MPLIQTIKSAQIAARKKRDSITASLLTTLIGEAEMVGKNANREVTDQEVVATIKKFIKNLDETIRIAGDYRDGDACDKAWTEKQALEKFLPKQLSEAEIRALISDFLGVGETRPNMGEVMKHMKSNYDGQYDGKVVSKIAGELLK
jgi:uncharacterized protein YqeY